MLRQIPQRACVILPAGSYIDFEVLPTEVERLDLGPDRLTVDRRAKVSREPFRCDRFDRVWHGKGGSPPTPCAERQVLLRLARGRAAPRNCGVLLMTSRPC